MASMMTVNDVSRALSVPSNIVRRWGDRGILKSYLFGNRGDRIFEKKDINRFLIETRLITGYERRTD